MPPLARLRDVIVRPDPNSELSADRRDAEMTPSERAPAGATVASHRHPTLGLPPIDMTAGFPKAAERIRVDRRRLAARSLEAAIAYDPSIADRYSELGLRRLLNDAEVLLERLARSIASGDPRWLAEYAEMAGPVYRRRAVPLADMQMLCEGIRDAVGAGCDPDERVALDTSIDAALSVFVWEARVAGDARKRNALLKFLYRGA